MSSLTYLVDSLIAEEAKHDVEPTTPPDNESDSYSTGLFFVP